MKDFYIGSIIFWVSVITLFIVIIFFVNSIPHYEDKKPGNDIIKTGEQAWLMI